MKTVSKICFILIFVLAFSIYHLAFIIDRVAAANAIPDPFVPCDEEEFENPEFHSLRPYQASPCGDSPKAFFCDNDYIIEEEVSTKWGPRCDPGELTCPYTGPIIKRNYEVFMKDVNFPILGNTQNVSNSQTAEDEFDDAQKLNEYVSWYLSGANQKAEYGDDTWDKTVNYSGPAKKLVPSVIQEWQRFETLHKAGVYLNYTDAEDMEGSPRDTDLTKSGVQVEETYNHNQIVVCTTRNILGIDNPWIGALKPIPCYNGGGNNAQGSPLRLLHWWEGKISGLREALNILTAWDGSQAWNSTIPPFPWQFSEDIYYQKAYQEWRGKSCAILPIVGLQCIDSPIITNKWADFYQYIPLGTTADKAASHPVGGVNIKGLGGTIAGRPQAAPGISESGTYFVEQNPVLYYPHTQETYDIATLLNETQSPQDVFGEKGQREANKGTTKDFETNACEIVDVRANPGDDLTFDQSNVEQKQRVYVRDVEIEVTQVGCLNDAEINRYLTECLGQTTGSTNSGQPQSGSGGNNTTPNFCNSAPSCDGVVQVVIRTTPKIPFADQIWEATTVGQESAFRRIFPKVEEGAPVSCIADIPGVSEVTYRPNSQTNLVGIDTPAGRKSPADAKLFFPHLGTIYEYFLKGIQTALRPQGYGEPIVNGELCETDETISCDQVAQEYGIPSCQLEGIMQLETGGGTNMGTESCGSANCCSAGVCGPAQIKCGDIESVSGGENINVCEPCGSAELLARLMKMKLCQADGKCNSYNWNDMKDIAQDYEVEDGDYTAACYFYGLQNGCFPTACTQYRWGPGKSYGDAVKSMCETGQPLPDNTSPQFCSACAQEDPRVQCNTPINPNQNPNQQIPI